MENNNNTRFLRGKLNTRGKTTGCKRQIHYVKYYYNHTEFNHAPKLSKLQKNTNSKYQVFPLHLNPKLDQVNTR